MSLDTQRAEFRRLHQAGTFVMPNPWDVGSARLLQTLGFPAIASSSAGYAWSQGRPDYGLARDEVLAHLRTLVAAVDLPVNADFENAFADDPAGVAANVTLAVEAGVSGLSVEDATWDGANPLYDFDLAVARVAAARAAIDATGSGVVLTARCEGLLTGGKVGFDEVLRRAKAFADVGADCVFTPGVFELDQVVAVVQALAPKPVNVVLFGPGRTVAELAAAGVRRVSTGGALAKAAYAAALQAMTQLKDDGAFQPFAPTAPFKTLNEAFAPK